MKRNLLFFLLSVSVLMTSCDLFNNYGKKVEINKSEVYYKGDGVTESDAKKLGDYLLKIGYFDNTSEKSVQLTKDENDKETYLVRFVVNPDALAKNKENALMTFWYWQDMLATGVFDDKKTRIVLADTKMKDIEVLDELQRITVGKEHYLYLKGTSIKEKEGKAIADSLEAAKFFDYTAGAAVVTKEKGAYTFRFMANETRQKDQGTDYNIVLENYRYIISKYLLDNSDVNLVMIDEEFNDIKSIKEPNDERKALIDQLIKGQQPENQTQYTNNQVEPQPATDDDIRGGSY